MKIRISVLKFLFIGMLFILANFNLHLNNPNERAAFYDYLYNWVDHLYQESLHIAGYVVKSEWLPQEVNLPDIDNQLGG
jgi:hypothetical protein